MTGAALELAGYLLTSLWVGAAIAGLAALVIRCWKPLDAATRYTVWYVALIAVTLGPLATTLALQRAQPQFEQIAVSAAAGRLPGDAVALRVASARPVIAVPAAVAYGAAALWLLVVLGGAARLVAGARVLARLKRDALPLAPERRAALPLWTAHAGAANARGTRLCVSDRVEVPVAVGLFDGMVVIPQQVVDSFEPSDVDRFVLHELAHLERRDDWTAALQRVVQLLMFFNPAVHVIARQLDLEREIACDDRVVAATSDVRSYAVGLTRMAEATEWPHRGIPAPAIFVTRRQLSVRVEQLLTRPRFATRRIAFAPALVAFAASLGVVAAAAQHGPSIALDAGTPHVPLAIRKTQFVIVRPDGTRTTVNAERGQVMVVRRERLKNGKLLPPSAADDALVQRALRDLTQPPQPRR